MAEEKQSEQTAESNDMPVSEPAPANDSATGNIEGSAHTEEISTSELRQALQAAEQQAAENLDKFMRAQAEMENIRRRSSRDLENARQYGIEPLMRELIPIRDSLERGLEAAAEHQASEEIDAMREGIRLTLSMLQSLFEKFQVVQLDPQGELFDPRAHEAMTMLTTDAVPDGHVVEVLEKGYQLHERVLRAAMVVVAKAPSNS
ncbi:MAG TPA: nucleotide exchange factor GrpE [Gammaproteobacteria bacterium]|nr:nucleotide exchange factor GrpE [Gammaproteobacteria bacterium]